MTLPPASLMHRVLIAWNSRRISRKSSGSQRSERPVESTISQNRTVSWRRSLVLPRRSSIEHSRQSLEPLFLVIGSNPVPAPLLGRLWLLRKIKATELRAIVAGDHSPSYARLGRRRPGHKRRPFCSARPSFPAANPGAVPGRRTDLGSGQQPGKKRVQHAASRVCLADPDRELLPSRPVGGFDMLPFHERTLVQQRDAVPFVSKLIEFIEESIPRQLVRAGVNGIDGENIAVVGVGQDGACILPDEIGPKGHVAAKAVCIEMLFTELEILAQRTQPLRAREGPERERVLG